MNSYIDIWVVLNEFVCVFFWVISSKMYLHACLVNRQMFLQVGSVTQQPSHCQSIHPFQGAPWPSMNTNRSELKEISKRKSLVCEGPSALHCPVDSLHVSGTPEMKRHGNEHTYLWQNIMFIKVTLKKSIGSIHDKVFFEIIEILHSQAVVLTRSLRLKHCWVNNCRRNKQQNIFNIYRLKHWLQLLTSSVVSSPAGLEQSTTFILTHRQDYRPRTCYEHHIKKLYSNKISHLFSGRMRLALF